MYSQLENNSLASRQSMACLEKTYCTTLKKPLHLCWVTIHLMNMICHDSNLPMHDTCSEPLQPILLMSQMRRKHLNVLSLGVLHHQEAMSAIARSKCHAIVLTRHQRTASFVFAYKAVISQVLGIIDFEIQNLIQKRQPPFCLLPRQWRLNLLGLFVVLSCIASLFNTFCE